MVRKQRVALTGTSGQLGGALERLVSPSCEVIALARPVVDITKWKSVRSAIVATRPHLVIHSAAYTDVDGCERDPDLAYRVNAIGTRNVCQAASLVGATVVYVSTNYVFSGKKADPYHEFDSTQPISVYGASKLAGEQEASRATDRCYIVRTAWLYATRGRSFVTTMQRLMSERSELTVVSDQHGNPTYADDLAATILTITQSCPFGIYHAVNSGVASWYEWSLEIQRLMRTDVLLRPISASEFPRVATPPDNGTMVSVGLQSAGIALPDWRDALQRCLLS
jgi:dTDP-4-dehydrorhamnose reductase